MKLPVILGFYVFGLGCLGPSAQNGGQPPAAAPEPPAPQTQSRAPSKETSQAATPTPAASGKTTPVKPPAQARRHKKAAVPNCATSPPASTGANIASDGSGGAAAENSKTPALPPCPPPKKVVHDGGSSEPSIQLVGGETADQAAHQSSTDKLTAATEENLKKIAGRQLTPSQQDMVSQIKQFMDQSKTAIAAGDLERGNNLAMKARLLSDELVRP